MVRDISIHYVLSIVIFLKFLIFPVVQSHLLVNSDPKGTVKFIVMKTWRCVLLLKL